LFLITPLFAFGFLSFILHFYCCSVYALCGQFACLWVLLSFYVTLFLTLFFSCIIPFFRSFFVCSCVSFFRWAIRYFSLPGFVLLQPPFTFIVAMCLCLSLSFFRSFFLCFFLSFFSLFFLYLFLYFFLSFFL
jgi:hypothetical protein